MDTGLSVPGGNESAALRPSSAGAGAPLRIERLDTVSAILTALGSLGGAAQTGFQTAPWLAAVYRHLVPATGAPLGIAIRCGRTGALLGLLPLYSYKHGRLTVAKFADCGVTDYNAILIRDAASAASLNGADLLALVKPACSGVDILALERLIAASPLADHPAATPASLSGNALTIETTVDDYIRSRGKKYRKEAERSFRVLQSHGAWTFSRANTPGEIGQAFAELERQQAGRHAGKGAQYALAAPQYAAFYRDLLLTAPATAHIFTLKVEGVIIAALLGVTHAGTFTLLRIANGGDAWRQVSPGRLIVIEAMRYFHPRGIATFDMGMGDYAFKRSFGTTPIPLTDLIVALSWRGAPTVAARRLKERLRENETLRSAVRRLKAYIRPGQA